MISINDYWKQCQELISETMQLKDSNMSDEEKKAAAGVKSSALKSLVEEIITFIRQHLVLGYDKFYGVMLLDMITKIDFEQQGAVDLDLRHNQFILKINPYFLYEKSIQQFEALIVSELLLLCMDIPTKFSELNSENDPTKHKYLTLAASAVAMNLTMNDIKIIQNRTGQIQRGLKIPADAYTVGDVRLDTRVNAASDKDLQYYYDLLNKHYKGKSSAGLAQGISDTNNSSYDKSLPSMPNNTDSNKDYSIHSWENATTKEDVHQKIKRLVQNTFNSLNEAERGLIPGAIQSSIQAMMQPSKIRWQQEIKSSFGTIRHGKIRTITKPNRRQPDRLDLPGKRQDRLLKVVMAIDTSGSVSDELLSLALNEIYTIVNSVQTEVTIIECDSQIAKKPYVAKKASDVQTTFQGRGGTCFTPAIEWINTHNYKDALLIFFTDGGGENDIPRPQVYKTIWLLPSESYRLSVREPYGKILYLDSDDQFKF